MLKNPTTIYINWAAYDELSDHVELTEVLALRQLDELLRLRTYGVRLDYYLMDAFWYAPDGGYRTWRTPHWPDGPARWLDRCLANDVKPGLWVTANTLCKMEVHPLWRESVDAQANAMCCFYGGFLPHFTETLHLYYERGVRLFKFDFANFDAAPAHLKATMLPSDIRATNISVWQGAMKAFKQSHSDVVFLAYNGYEEVYTQYGTSGNMKKAVDQRWLEVFDAIYCGDPRAADVPAMNFWRAKDVYSDHMVRVYAFNGLPLERIDNAGFMIGTTGTCYFRKTAAWQGMLLLSLARGGWANTYYGNLDLLDAEKAAWFARAQELYLPLQAIARTHTFGGVPGDAEPYGFAVNDDDKGVITVVNPAQRVATLALPTTSAPMRIIFRDAGFSPTLDGAAITLGPEQMAVVGLGTNADCDLGVQEDVIIPRAIEPLNVTFTSTGEKTITTTVVPPATGALRIVLQQADAGGPVRISGGSPPHGVTLATYLRLQVVQGGRDVPVTINYDKAIWSGLSWAVGEVDAGLLISEEPVTITCTSSDPRPGTVTGAMYTVAY